MKAGRTVLPLALVVLLPICARPAGGSAVTDEDCLGCHSDPRLKSGAGTFVAVDPEKFRASVHGQAKISCVDCHADLRTVKNFPHAEKLKSASCAGCHEEEARVLKTGVHGGAAAEKGGPAVDCKDCHGTHDIRGAADPESSIYPANLPKTCGRCHPGATRHVAEGKIHNVPGAAGAGIQNRLPAIMKTVYIVMISAIVGGFLLFISADLFRRASGGRPMNDLDLIRDDEIFVRMNPAERIQHYLLILTVITLMATGLPVFFYELKFFKWIFPAGRAFAARGVLHRVAAVLLAASLVWHASYTAFTARGRANFRALIPRAKDFRDAFEQLFYNLGITRLLSRFGIGKKFFAGRPYWLFKDAPRYDRYDFVEKFEYWAVAWGSAVMIVSGFFMWKVELSLRLFPLWVHNIFIIVHSYEAILAFLAIIIWHMYNVHLNPEAFPMSKIWLNGKIMGRELRTLHPLEYERILEERKRTIETKRKKIGVGPQ